MPMQFPRMLRPARSPLPVAQSAVKSAQHHEPVLTPSTTPAVLSVPQAVEQLAHSLTLLRNAAEQRLYGTTIEPTDHLLRQRLSPSARQAEAAMKHLRALPLPTTAAWIELTQALTVVVLAADMLAEGQLSPALMADTYALLHHNAERALHSLDAVQAQRRILAQR